MRRARGPSRCRGQRAWGRGVSWNSFGCGTDRSVLRSATLRALGPGARVHGLFIGEAALEADERRLALVDDHALGDAAGWADRRPVVVVFLAVALLAAHVKEMTLRIPS